MTSETTTCECGGEIVGHGGISDPGGTHEGFVWGGNCVKCGRGYGENEDETPRGFDPVDQTTFGRGKGDCFAAAIATITGLPLDQLRDRLGIGSGGTWEGDVWVPAPGEEDWFGRAIRVMREYGWDLQYTTLGSPPGLSVACGLAIRGLRHSVVALDGRIVHDPHPSRDGLIKADSWIALVKVPA